MWPLRLSPRQAQGRDWERAALLHLRRHGLVPVEENFRCKGGEIDLVMRGGIVCRPADLLKLVPKD